MRFSLFALCSTAFCSIIVVAQQLQRDPLRDYLKATQDQWEQLLINSLGFQATYPASARQLAALHRELSVETLKSTLNPAELGQRYRQIEDFCRSLAAPHVELYRKQMQVLNPDQRALVLSLAGGTELFLLENVAQGLFLQPKPPASGGSDGTAFEHPSFYFDPVKYLSLTEGQQEQIRLLHLDYRQFFETSYSRMRAAASDLEKEIAQESYSDERLGAFYAEIETIRRLIADRENLLRRELSSALTQPQRDLLAGLDHAFALWTLHLTASRLVLFPPDERPRPASTAEFRISSVVTADSSTDGFSVGGTAADTINRHCKGLPLVSFFGDLGIQQKRP